MPCACLRVLPVRRLLPVWICCETGDAATAQLLCFGRGIINRLMHHHPAGLFAPTGGRSLKELRDQCTEQRIPFSISDDWRSLEMRLAVQGGISAAQECSNMEPLLKFCVGAYGEEGLLIVRASWLCTQVASSLAHHDGREGAVTLEELRTIHERFGSSLFPLIALRDPWCSTSANDSADTRAGILIEAFHAVAERQRRVAEEHKLLSKQMDKQRRTVDSRHGEARSRRCEVETRLSVAHVQLEASTLRSRETAELAA
jgi:hypothetical protein